MVKFTTYPKQYGYYLHPPQGPPATELDLMTLTDLRMRFADREGELITWKEDLQPLLDELPGLRGTMRRLWCSQLVIKFARQFHTISNEPEYTQYLIWEEEE